MNGIVGLEQLRVNCLIGCHPDEWKVEQELLIDLKVETSIALCVNSDNIKDAVNYVRLTEICSEVARRKPHHLIESLANDIIQKVISEFQIISVWIKIRKKPKILPQVDYTTVELRWEKR